MVAAPNHRVVCPDFTQYLPSLASARRHLAQVEAAGKCRQHHTIEVFVEGEWLAEHIARARSYLGLTMGGTAETPDGPLVKAGGGWSKEAGDRADAIANPEVDAAAWLAALGPHEWAWMTSDGQAVRTDTWCACAAREDSAAWVRYEQWTAEGRVSHGWACPSCRCVTQTG